MYPTASSQQQIFSFTTLTWVHIIISALLWQYAVHEARPSSLPLPLPLPVIVRQLIRVLTTRSSLPS